MTLKIQPVCISNGGALLRSKVHWQLGWKLKKPNSLVLHVINQRAATTSGAMVATVVGGSVGSSLS